MTSQEHPKRSTYFEGMQLLCNNAQNAKASTPMPEADNPVQTSTHHSFSSWAQLQAALGRLATPTTSWTVLKQFAKLTMTTRILHVTIVSHASRRDTNHFLLSAATRVGPALKCIEEALLQHLTACTAECPICLGENF